MDQGRVALAEEHAKTAKRLATTNHARETASMALVAPLLATIEYERGNFNEAEKLVAPRLELISCAAMLESAAQAYLALARSVRSQGRPFAAYAYLEQGETLAESRGWSRLVVILSFERLTWMVDEKRVEQARATAMKIERIVGALTSPPSGEWDELRFYRDWAFAMVARSEGRLGNTIDSLTGLLGDALSKHQILRAIKVGTMLSGAHAAQGQKSFAIAELSAVLALAADRGDIRRSILDYAGELRVVLRELSEGELNNPSLTDYARRLLAGEDDPLPVETATTPSVAPLTRREKEVLDFLARGFSNKEIARHIHVSDETVKTHLKSLFAKLGISRRAQASTAARIAGISLPTDALREMSR
jgi:ATP/maltotriose-dependent transcriptional regulator MalT